MTKYLKLTSPEGVELVKSGLVEITQHQIKNLKLVGIASGGTLDDCILFGLANSGDFAVNAKYYLERKTLSRNDLRFEVLQEAIWRKEHVVFIDFYGDRA